MFDFLKPKTVKGILANIYKQIDQLEVVAEQQEQIYAQAQNQIDELRVAQVASLVEGDLAERVATKLRALIEA